MRMAEIWFDIFKSKWLKGIRVILIATSCRKNAVKRFAQIPCYPALSILCIFYGSSKMTKSLISIIIVHWKIGFGVF